MLWIHFEMHIHFHFMVVHSVASLMWSLYFSSRRLCVRSVIGFFASSWPFIPFRLLAKRPWNGRVRKETASCMDVQQFSQRNASSTKLFLIYGLRRKKWWWELMAHMHGTHMDMDIQHTKMSVSVWCSSVPNFTVDRSSRESDTAEHEQPENNYSGVSDRYFYAFVV